jgi:UDP-N-acetylmuramyl pentapeptide phosphotransferase/UDP-N-acetylglucosamine-1-phosphate transferase
MIPTCFFRSQYIGFHAFNRSLRAACAITAFLVCFIVGEGIIERLKSLRLRERIGSGSDWLAQKHVAAGKGGTPTMGGMIFVLAAVLGTLLFARLDRPLVLVGLWTMTAMGVLGGYDDRIKLLLPRPRPEEDARPAPQAEARARGASRSSR